MPLQRGHIRAQLRQPLHLHRMLRLPVLDCGLAATHQRLEQRNRLGAGGRHVADDAQRLFPRGHPVVEQQRVVQEKGRHTKTGGVADAQHPRDFRIQTCGGFASLLCTRVRHMLHQIAHKPTGQKDRQHFHLKRRAKLRSPRDHLAICRAQLARPVDRSGAHQIANGVDLVDRWLRPRRQLRNHMVP